jgi:hypothetical protein
LFLDEGGARSLVSGGVLSHALEVWAEIAANGSGSEGGAL